MDDPGLNLDLLAASIRADAKDLGLFIEVLASKLGDAIPNAITVEHEGGLFSKKKVKRLHIQLADDRYSLSRAGQGLKADHSHAVRGITLKTESIGVEEWIDILIRHLAELARSSAQARNALNSLLQQ